MTEEHTAAHQQSQPPGNPCAAKRGLKRARGKKTRRLRVLLLSLLCVCIVAGGLLLAAVLPCWLEARNYPLGIIRTMANPHQATLLPIEDFPFLHGEKPILLELEQFPEQLRDALIAREDSRFWKHHGVDLRGVARAALRNLREGAYRQGAGTITMQLVRTAYQFQARTLQRKMLETMLALRIEHNFTKSEILASYMNWVFLGMDNHGFEQASREYFHKPVAALSLGEGATLVGMLRAPNRLDPVRHPQAARQERDAVLQRMIDEGMLPKAEAQQAMARPMRARHPITPRKPLTTGAGK